MVRILWACSGVVAGVRINRGPVATRCFASKSGAVSSSSIIFTRFAPFAAACAVLILNAPPGVLGVVADVGVETLEFSPNRIGTGVEASSVISSKKLAGVGCSTTVYTFCFFSPSIPLFSSGGLISCILGPSFFGFIFSAGYGTNGDGVIHSL